MGDFWSMLKKISETLSGETSRLLKRSRNAMRLITGSLPRVGQTPHHVVFQRNKMSLLRYECPKDTANPEDNGTETIPEELRTERSNIPILIVPSVINRHYILDLQKDRSFVEYLVKQGFDVFVISWGKVTEEDRYQTFDDYIEMLVEPSVRRICRFTGHDKIHLVGHCLGGIMALPYAALYPERIASFLNLTGPVDLRHGGILRRWTDSMDVDVMVDALGNAPWPLLQTTFHMMKPMGLLQKTAWFYEQLWKSDVVDSFVALETWANDNVSLSGEFFRTYIKEIYQKNALYNGTLIVRGRRVDLSKITVPVYNVAAKNDHIATEASVLALKDVVPQTENLVVYGGHVGVVVSRSASKKVWPKIVAFFDSIS